FGFAARPVRLASAPLCSSIPATATREPLKQGSRSQGYHNPQQPCKHETKLRKRVVCLMNTTSSPYSSTHAAREDGQMMCELTRAFFFLSLPLEPMFKCVAGGRTARRTIASNL